MSYDVLNLVSARSGLWFRRYSLPKSRGGGQIFFSFHAIEFDELRCIKVGFSSIRLLVPEILTFKGWGGGVKIFGWIELDELLCIKVGFSSIRLLVPEILAFKGGGGGSKFLDG